MTQTIEGATVGVDTHSDVHVAAAFDQLGRPLGHLEIPNTPAGYHQLLAWARGLGPLVAFGVEGTGSYGARLARFLAEAGCQVVEINRPNRRVRQPVYFGRATSVFGVYSVAPWHRLYFLPDPQGQIAFRLTTGTEPVELVRFGCGGDVAPGAPGPSEADGASN